MQSTKTNHVTIVFCQKGEAVSDWDIKNYVDNVVSSILRTPNDSSIFEVSTHLVIDEIRARIREKKIEPEQITIWVEDENSNLIEKPIFPSGGSLIWEETENIAEKILLMRLL